MPLARPHSLQALLEGTGQGQTASGHPRQQDQLTTEGTQSLLWLQTKQSPHRAQRTADRPAGGNKHERSGCPVHATRPDHAKTWNLWSRRAKEYMASFPRHSHDTPPHRSTQCSSMKWHLSGWGLLLHVPLLWLSNALSTMNTLL